MIWFLNQQTSVSSYNIPGQLIETNEEDISSNMSVSHM